MADKSAVVSGYLMISAVLGGQVIRLDLPATNGLSASADLHQIPAVAVGELAR
jgi:hypothetical protein